MVAVDDTTRNLTQPDLGAAQILQDRELGLGLRGDPPDRLECGGMHLMRAMREVEPEDVNPRLDHLSHDQRITRRRTDRRHDLGPDRSQLLFVKGFHKPINDSGTTGGGLDDSRITQSLRPARWPTRYRVTPIEEVRADSPHRQRAKPNPAPAAAEIASLTSAVRCREEILSDFQHHSETEADQDGTQE